MTTTVDHPIVDEAPEKLLSVEDVCAYLGVSKDFVYDEVRHGHLRASRIARQLRFRPPDVEAFIDASSVSGIGL
jgi:excisionase family DNA binding protein